MLGFRCCQPRSPAWSSWEKSVCPLSPPHYRSRSSQRSDIFHALAFQIQIFSKIFFPLSVAVVFVLKDLTFFCRSLLPSPPSSGRRSSCVRASSFVIVNHQLCPLATISNHGSTMESWQQAPTGASTSYRGICRGCCWSLAHHHCLRLWFSRRPQLLTIIKITKWKWTTRTIIGIVSLGDQPSWDSDCKGWFGKIKFKPLKWHCSEASVFKTGIR